MRESLAILILLAVPYCMCGQYFLEFHSEYDDSFREWDIVLENDSTELYGQLQLTWAINNDFTQWQYRVEDHDGEIYQKFKNNTGLWELASGDRVVSIRQQWPGDLTEWKISCEGRSFVFRPIYPHQLDEWSIVGEEYGELVLYTEYRGDPRDWLVSDYTKDMVTFEERMAAIFIALYVSTPKR